MKKLLNKIRANYMEYLLMLVSAVILSYFIDIQTVLAQPDVSDFVKTIGEEADLYIPGDSELHRRALDAEGISIIQTIIFRFLDVAKWLLGAGAVLMAAILGVRLTITSKSEEMITEAKRHMMYMLVGFIVVMLSDVIVQNVFFGAQGEVLENVESVKFFAGVGSLEVQRIYSAIEFFVGVVAVLFIIYYGFRMVTSAGEDIDTYKKGITWAIAGLVLVGVSELIVKDILFVEQGKTIDIQRGIELIISFTNFIAAFVSFLSVALVIYAGIQYVITFANEGSQENAKKALIAAIIGMLIVAGAYALTSTLISFQG